MRSTLLHINNYDYNHPLRGPGLPGLMMDSLYD